MYWDSGTIRAALLLAQSFSRSKYQSSNNINDCRSVFMARSQVPRPYQTENEMYNYVS
jgi:hypothetical protein